MNDWADDEAEKAIQAIKDPDINGPSVLAHKLRVAYHRGKGDVAESDKLAVVETLEELASSYKKFPQPLNSTHEGYAVILEELDELWDTVKKNEPKKLMRAEAVQVAAMSLRFILDLCKPSKKKAKK